MAVQQLVWRAPQARGFTAWPFPPAPGARAGQSMALRQPLSTLHGAILDDATLMIEQANPAPASGTEVRRPISLYPDKPIKPKAGINYIKFSIPGPIEALVEIAEAKNYTHSLCQALARE